MSNRCEAIPAGCDLSAPEPESLQGPSEHIRAEHRLGRVRDPRQRALLRWRCGTNGAGVLPPTPGSLEVEEQNHRVLQLHNGGAVRYAATRAAVRGEPLPYLADQRQGEQGGHAALTQRRHRASVVARLSAACRAMGGCTCSTHVACKRTYASRNAPQETDGDAPEGGRHRASVGSRARRARGRFRVGRRGWQGAGIGFACRKWSSTQRRLHRRRNRSLRVVRRRLRITGSQGSWRCGVRASHLCAPRLPRRRGRRQCGKRREA